MAENSSVTNSFCVLPWIHSFVNSNGNYQVCCTSEEHHLAITDDNGNFFNIKNRPTQLEIMNSKFMKNLRKDMLESKWNKICTRCLVGELTDGVSRRQIENKNFQNIIEEIKSNTTEDGSIQNVKYKSIDYRLGNLCNLQCRMCGPHSSSAWIKDWNKIKPKDGKLDKRRNLKIENYDWIEKDYLLEEFQNKLEHCEYLHFAGGEPLITPQMSKMLKYCIDKNFSKNIELTYNTNLTKLPESVLELWKYFKGVKLLCSVDGFNKVNDYIRHPSKWEVFDRNLTFLDSNAEKYNIKEILLSTTVQIYNILDLPNLYEYIKKFKVVIPALNLVNLHHPRYLQTTVLPENVKIIAKICLEDYYVNLKSNLPDHYMYLADNLLQAINFMNNQENKDQLKIFFEINERMDQLKGVSLKEEIPELYNLIINKI
jgi:organic radical activating enzyme